MVVSGEGNFHIEDPLDEWMTGTATLEDLVISTPDFAVATRGPTGIRLQDARVHIEGLGLAQGDSGVRLAGSVGLDDQLLDLTLSGRISLLAAEPFLEGLTSQGPIRPQRRDRRSVDGSGSRRRGNGPRRRLPN